MKTRGSTTTLREKFFDFFMTQTSGDSPSGGRDQAS